MVIRAALPVLLLVLAAPPIRAQVTHSLALTAGASQYDVGGTGTAPIVALRWEVRLDRALILEPGIARSRYGSTTRWFPEGTVQVQVPGRVQPFVGAGVGVSFASNASGSYRRLTLLALAGLRIYVVDRWTVRAELRYREEHPWHMPPDFADWAAGVSYRL
jgi:hypothetical protein